MNPKDAKLQQELAERFRQLPQIVQDAIISADVEKNLRTLADTQKLHLDQWQILENEVMLTLLGIQQIENLQKNIKDQVGVSDEIAHDLAENVNKIVFEPIRQELERQLEHPDAQAKEVSDVEAARNQALAGASAPALEASTATPAPTLPAQPVAPQVAPATPPQPAPDIKVTRPSESTAYKPGETSAARAEVHDDPYREPPK